MTRQEAKNKAMSRDCHCVKGKDRDNNYNSIIDELFDWHEKVVKENELLHSVSNCHCDGKAIETAKGIICYECEKPK